MDPIGFRFAGKPAADGGAWPRTAQKPDESPIAPRSQDRGAAERAARALARLAPGRFELLDDRRRRAVMHVGHETQRFIFDDRKCCRQFPLAALAIGVAGRREIGFSVRGPKPSPHSRTSS